MEATEPQQDIAYDHAMTALVMPRVVMKQTSMWQQVASANGNAASKAHLDTASGALPWRPPPRETPRRASMDPRRARAASASMLPRSATGSSSGPPDRRTSTEYLKLRWRLELSYGEARCSFHGSSKTHVSSTGEGQEKMLV